MSDFNDNYVDQGFTLDPEDHPGEPLVQDPWSGPPENGYEVVLSFDPDGYMFGKPRRWLFAVHPLDPRFPASKRDYELLKAVAETCRGETTEFVEKEVMRRFAHTLRKNRDRLIVTSDDGERELIFDYQKKPVRICKEPIPTEPTPVDQDDDEFPDHDLHHE